MAKPPTTLNEEAYILMVRWYRGFLNLSMDRQGDLSLELADKLRGWLELTTIDGEA